MNDEVVKAALVLFHRQNNLPLLPTCPPQSRLYQASDSTGRGQQYRSFQLPSQRGRIASFPAKFYVYAKYGDVKKRKSSTHHVRKSSRPSFSVFHLRV